MKGIGSSCYISVFCGMDGEGIFVSEGGWSEEGFAFMIWGERRWRSGTET